MSNKKATVALKQTLRISEAARLLGVTPMTLRRWDEAGILKARRMGPRGDRRYTREQILDVLKHGVQKEG